jgi:hypothetical protein
VALQSFRPAPLLLALVLLSPAFATVARAQGTASPGPHFGFSAFPELAPVHQIGLQFALFTEYGKPGDGRFGDYDGLPTMGINLLSLSNTRVLNRNDDLSSNLLFTSTFQLGWSNDAVTRRLQNQVRHRMLKVDYVARGRTREQFEVGYGGQIVYRIIRDAWSKQGEPVHVPTPLFALAGFNVGSLFADTYVGLGLRNLIGPYFLYERVRRVFFLSFSVMSRLGMPFSTCGVVDKIGLECALQTPATYYLANQASVTVHLLEAWYPIRAELGWMGHTGIFVDRDRQPMPERFWTFRLSLGDFVFEIANDSGGRKDIGPTMATQIYYNVPIGTPFFSNLLNVL